MLNRLKISLILAPLALMMLVGVYIYSLWSEDRDRRAEIPFDATQVMNRDLLKFHQKRGSFPEKLEDLEGIVWEKKGRNYVSHGRSMMHRNYFYMYSRLTSHRYTLWAIPIGKAREEASTLFLVGTPPSDRRWKGPALPVPDIENLLPAPSSNNLNMLGLFEQPNTRQESKSK
ncbi:MAG TPA: hypothetical protein PLL77_16265 [Pyrinomonadaceae bacterium]|nr:hypothetical protein [Pyrinomonadaceae bacterium]